MLNGTKRLFPNDYQDFKKAMLEAEHDNELPIVLELTNIRDFTLKDLEDTFIEFNMDTDLAMEGGFFISPKTGKLCLMVKVDRPKHKEKRVLH